MSRARGGACLSIATIAASAAALATLLAACSGAPVAPGSQRPAAENKAISNKPKLPYESPARWSPHPFAPAVVRDRLRLPDGSCLLLEANGQRWISAPRRAKPEPVIEPETMEDVDPGASDGFVEDPTETLLDLPASCDGEGRAATERTPEPILGLVRWPGAYGVVGVSGTIHVATSPLGPFVRRIAPPEKLLQAKSTGGAVLAISDTGRLYRFTEEAGWKRVDLGDVHALSVVTAHDGRAAVLAAPEALFTSIDAGLTFQRSSAPSVGVQRIAREKSGLIVAEGVLTALAWDPRKDGASFDKSDTRIEEATPTVTVTTGRAPDGYAVAATRSTIDGDRYWEVGPNDAGDWRLYRGSIEGPLHEVEGGPLFDGETISSLGICARDNVIATVVLRWSETQGTAEIQRSADNGRSFRVVARLGLGTSNASNLAVEPSGSVLVTGLCLFDEKQPESTDPDAVSEEPTCVGGPILIPPDGAPTLARAPFLDGVSEAPAFSPDGKSAYFLFSGGSDGRTSLFVSHDGGRTFEERLLDIDDDQRQIGFSVPSVAAIRIGDDGTLGMELGASGDISGSVWVTTDADGKLLRIGEPPVVGSVLAGFGSKVISFDPAHQDDDPDSLLYESLDGGATWAKVPWPELLRESLMRRAEAMCGAGGCVIGTQLTRVGWGVAEDRSPPFTPPKRDLPTGMRTTIACEPRPGSKWTRVENTGGAMPDEGSAARGATAWMIPTYDPETGEWTAVSASAPKTAGDESKITSKRLLGPTPKGTRWAFAHRPQIEGISLARAPLGPMDPSQQGTPWAGRRIRDLEVAWENLEEGTTGHATLPDSGTFDRFTITQSGAGRFSFLNMEMLSVSPGGMFVRSQGSREAFFVEPNGKARAFQFPELPDNLLNQARLSTGDAVNVDGTFIANADVYSSTNPLQILLFLRPPAKGSAPSTPWTPWAQMLSPGSAYEGLRYTRTEWTYDDKHLAVWTLHTVPDAAYARGWLRRILADGTLGPPQHVPTPYELGATPRACTAEEHRSLPRFRFEHEGWGQGSLRGVRHAIVIHEDGAPKSKEPPPPAVAAQIEADRDPLSSAEDNEPATSFSIGDVAMISTGVVMRGRGQVACLDAIAGRDPLSMQRRVVIAGDLSYGWFFRKAAPKPQAGKKAVPSPLPPSIAIEARPLTCRFAPEREPPSVVLSADGR